MQERKERGQHDAAGVPRARGKCTVVDVNPPTTSRAASWVLSGLVGPHYRPAGPREPSPAYRAPPSEISRYRFIGRFNGLSPPSRATGMIEWWKNSTGKARRFGKERADERGKTSERSATKKTTIHTRARENEDPVTATAMRFDERSDHGMKMTTIIKKIFPAFRDQHDSFLLIPMDTDTLFLFLFLFRSRENTGTTFARG